MSASSATVVLILKVEQSRIRLVDLKREWHGQENSSKRISPASVFAPGSGMERGIGGENSPLRAQYDDWLQGHPQLSICNPWG
jgi:hypothetical protein